MINFVNFLQRSLLNFLRRGGENSKFIRRAREHHLSLIFWFVFYQEKMNKEKNTIFALRSLKKQTPTAATPATIFFYKTLL